MNAINGFSDMLFPEAGRFVEANYLAFLAQQIPKDIVDQLKSDCSPELDLSKSIGIDDLMRPLSSHSFPSRELLEMAAILSYTIICYRNARDEQPTRDDPYKLIYAISLYLHCFVCGQGPEAGAYLTALGILTDVSVRLDFETRLQVSRFLSSLVPTICAEATRVSALLNEPAPASSALLALSVIISSVVSDLSVMAENTMKGERVSSTWAAEEAYPTTSSYQGIVILKRCVSEMYGPTGKVRQIADRFLPAIEDGKTPAEN
jgi:hypothetical protein